MWDAVFARPFAIARPAATVYSVASGAERHTKRHTGGVRTAKLGAIQRRLLVALLNLAWDEARDKSVDLTDARVRWKPSKAPPPGFDPEKDAPALSKALASLHKRRLVIVDRHAGGRAHAVRLTTPGVDVALSIQRLGGRTVDHASARLSRLLPADLVSAVPIAQRQVRRTGIPDEYRDALRLFLDLYERWTGDPDVDVRGTGNVTPGIGATPATFVDLLKAHDDLVTCFHLPPSITGK